MKANIAADILGAAVVSIPGVSSWQLALMDLTELLPNGGSVVVALDADWRTNPAVQRAAWGLSRSCAALDYHAEIALWERTTRAWTIF